MGRPYLRHTAKIDGDFVVFLIGARLVKPWMLWKMAPVGKAMNAMVKELEGHPELGYLDAEGKLETAAGRLGLTDGTGSP